MAVVRSDRVVPSLLMAYPMVVPTQGGEVRLIGWPTL
jgi:hypothetical protein